MWIITVSWQNSIYIDVNSKFVTISLLLLGKLGTPQDVH